MLFTSYEFLEFLFLLFLLYYILPSRWQWKLLLAAGFLFYFYAGPVYCVYTDILYALVDPTIQLQ